RLGGAALERAAERSHPFPGGVRGAAAPLRCGIRCHRATARAGGWYQPLLRPPAAAGRLPQRAGARLRGPRGPGHVRLVRSHARATGAWAADGGAPGSVRAPSAGGSDRVSLSDARVLRAAGPAGLGTSRRGRSVSRPPRVELVEADRAVAVGVDRVEPDLAFGGGEILIHRLHEADELPEGQPAIPVDIVEIEGLPQPPALLGAGPHIVEGRAVFARVLAHGGRRAAIFTPPRAAQPQAAVMQC